MELFGSCKEKINAIVLDLLEIYPEDYLVDILGEPTVKCYPGEIEYNSIFIETEKQKEEIISGVYWDEIDSIYAKVCEYIQELKDKDELRGRHI